MPRERTYLTAALITVFGTATLHAQEKALQCLLNADFEAGLPAGWDIGAPVAVVSDGGTTVDAWRVANAIEANVNGFFPVPDLPYNGRFVMANDDAAPCDCDMASVSLTSPVVDLSGTSGAVLQYRVFHDGNFNGGTAAVEASTDGNAWTRVDSIPAVERAWQHRFVDLGAYDGIGGVQLRFRWSDNGQWASGIAVDDVCIRGRLAEDLTLVEAFIHDPEPSPFNTAVRSLRYTQLPLQQVDAITVAARVRNSGRNTARQVRMNVNINQNGNTQGPFPSAVLDSLVPGEEALLRVATGWTPTAVGELSFSYAVEAQATDEDVLDNTAQQSMRITGPGWADGYGALGSATEAVEGTLSGTGVYAVLARAELGITAIAPSGISVRLGAGTTEGTTIRALVLDQNLSFLDTSARWILGSDDLERIAAGEDFFFPLSGNVALSGDVHFGVQSLISTDQLEVLMGGGVPPGAAVTLEGVFLDVGYPQRAPYIWMHMEEVGVGVYEHPRQQGRLRLQPQVGSLLVTFPETIENGELVLYDTLGRQRYVLPIAAPTRWVEVPMDGPLRSSMVVVVLRSAQGHWSAQHVQGM